MVDPQLLYSPWFPCIWANVEENKNLQRNRLGRQMEFTPSILTKTHVWRSPARKWFPILFGWDELPIWRCLGTLFQVWRLVERNRKHVTRKHTRNAVVIWPCISSLRWEFCGGRGLLGLVMWNKNQRGVNFILTFNNILLWKTLVELFHRDPFILQRLNQTHYKYCWVLLVNIMNAISTTFK